MALTPTEEAQTRQLIAQEAPLLSLASNEPTITSKLGATKVNLSQLPAATVPADADIYLVRQGTTDKSVAGSVLKTYFATTPPPAASETVAGIVRLATDAETIAGTARNIAVDPGGLAAKLAAITPAGIQGAFKNLVVSTTGTSALVTVTVDELIVESTANAYLTLRALSVTPSLTVSGANGLDTGTSAASTWYAVWVVWNGITAAGLLSLSATSPAMPSGYTHKARVGWVRTDGSANKYLLFTSQKGADAQYLLGTGTNLVALPVLASGVQGSPGSSMVSASVSAFVPPTARAIKGSISNGATGSAQASPNSISTVPGGSSIFMGVIGVTIVLPFDFLLESTNVYYAASASGSMMLCLGWRDNL